MTLVLPTASKLSLAAHCLHPWAPGATWPTEESDEAARVGSATHARIEAALLGTEAPAVDGLTPGEARRVEALVEAALARVDELTPEGWTEVLGVETSYGVDLRTGRARILGHGRAYDAATSTEVVGTDDLTLRHVDGRIRVVDWKTGRDARLTRAGASPQMRFLGLARASLEGLDEVEVELAHLDEDGCHSDVASLDAFDLAAVASELRAIRGEALRPGPWCRRCPMRPVCPATRLALVRVGEEVAVLPLEAGTLTEEQARAVYVFAPLVRARLDALEAAAEEVARRCGVDMGDGTVMSAVEHEGRERVEMSPRAEEILRGRGLAGALEVSTSKAAIERTARAVAPKRGGAALSREVLSELREAGAVTRGSPYVTVESRPLLRATEE